jgi:hypothetical protein
LETEPSNDAKSETDKPAAQLVRDILVLFIHLQTAHRDITELETNVTKTTKDLKSLTKPSLFLDAYPSVLKEVNRRLLFDNLIREDLSNLNAVIKGEIAMRKRFLTENDEGLHETFLPELELVPSVINLFKSTKQE